MANCSYQGAEKIIVHEINIIPDFFDLKTGIAGEVLQKFSTYNIKLAIVGDFLKYSSKSLRDFIYESNKTGRINFVNSVNEAKEKLLGNEKVRLFANLPRDGCFYALDHVGTGERSSGGTCHGGKVYSSPPIQSCAKRAVSNYTEIIDRCDWAFPADRTNITYNLLNYN